MKKGILLMASGHSYYGKMAAALAASIRCVSDIQIALFYHGNALEYLSKAEMGLFNQVSQLEDKYVLNSDGSFNPVKARMYMYELSPFEQTLSVGVDNIWLKKKPEQVFEELKDVSFTIQNGGFSQLDENADKLFSVWADIHEVAEAYGIKGKKFYQTYGEWIYSKKDATAKKIFNAARKIFLQKPKTEIHDFIGQSIPDELAFSIAMAQTEIYPHTDNYLPTTYRDINSKGKHRFAPVYKLTGQYFTISMGGNRNPSTTVTNYNLLTSAAYQTLGLQQPHKWKTKRSFLPERKTI
jgi:hypothetical protein